LKKGGIGDFFFITNPGNDIIYDIGQIIEQIPSLRLSLSKIIQ
jgi:hypothetical protein